MSNRLDCEPLPSSIRSARLFVVDKLQEWRCDELVDRVALLTSELATNAVVHTGQPYSVSVEKRGPRVRVEVADQVSELPSRRDLAVDLTDSADAGPSRGDEPEHAFSGLGIVDATATDWGSEHVPGGKVVWFELAAGQNGASSSSARHDLRDLREMPDAPPNLAGDLDRPLDDWVVALDRARLPLWARVVLVIAIAALVVLVALIIRG